MSDFFFTMVWATLRSLCVFRGVIFIGVAILAVFDSVDHDECEIHGSVLFFRFCLVFLE